MLDSETMDSTKNPVPKGLKPWKPGQSGNPGGRPKGVPGLASTLKRLVAQKHPDQRRKWAEVLVRRVLRDAENGDANAMALVWKYAEGLPVAKLPEGSSTGIMFVVTAPPGVDEPDIIDVKPKRIADNSTAPQLPGAQDHEGTGPSE